MLRFRYQAISRRKAWFGIVFTLISLGLISGYLLFQQSSKKTEDLEIARVALLEQYILPKESISDADTDCTVSTKVLYYYYSNQESAHQKNNKVGLYVYAENKRFINAAAALVNSNGGDWGYVLIPYNIQDRDSQKWREVFELLLEKHLIPIIQLHLVSFDSYEEDTKEAAYFLDSFLWPVKQRYISVYNEPNDANFWFGRVNPEEYAQILDYTIDTFKGVSEDYFMLNGALNVSARTQHGYLDAYDYMHRMNDEVPGIFAKLDGFASHSYPQPNFSGSPYAVGRNSIVAYKVEIEYLEEILGVEKHLPVFITETGWAHAEGEQYNSSFLTQDVVADYFRVAYEEIWFKDPRVVAVTPFTVWYEAPFDHFSWLTKDYQPYKHYNSVMDIKKVAGTPQKLEERVVEDIVCQ